MTFEAAFAFVVGVEGVYSRDPRDKGNWTSGQRGVGELKGTKYGVSAASYPLLDLEHLSLAEARAIYEQDYWRASRCQLMPPAWALLVFDAAVHSGPWASIQFAQRALWVADDGICGPITLAAIQRASSDMDRILQALRYRHDHQSEGDPEQWRVNKGGWMIRLMRLAIQCSVWAEQANEQVE